MPSRSPTTVSEAREDAYYARHKSTLEQGVGLAIDAAVVEGAGESDARGNGPDPMLFVAKQILAQHGIDTEGVHSGTFKWWGITAVGTKVYAAPSNARTAGVLALDTVSVTASGEAVQKFFLSTESVALRAL